MPSLESKFGLPENTPLDELEQLLQEEAGFWSYEAHSPQLNEAQAKALISALKTANQFPEQLASETGEHRLRLKKYLLGHGIRTAILALLINERIAFQSQSTRSVVAQTALLHDVGKLRPDILAVIQKRERIGWKDKKIIREHTRVGARTLGAHSRIQNLTGGENELWTEMIKAVMFHHERYDGGGYEGLPKEKVPELSWTIGLADAVDVMLSGRHYQKPLTPTQAVEELKRCSGKKWNKQVLEGLRPDQVEEQFNPKSVDALTSIWPRKEGKPAPFFKYYRSSSTD